MTLNHVETVGIQVLSGVICGFSFMESVFSCMIVSWCRAFSVKERQEIVNSNVKLLLTMKKTHNG